MTGKSPEKLQLVLTAEEGMGRIVVDMEAFFEFSFELAEELQDLVARWKHLAAPPTRPRRTQQRSELD